MTSSKIGQGKVSRDTQRRAQAHSGAQPAARRRVTVASASPPPPAAGAHAAAHLTNEDATPGCGALTSRSHTAGKEVDGGAG